MNKLSQILSIVVFLAILILTLVVAAYVFVWVLIVGLVLFAIAYIRAKLKSPNKPSANNKSNDGDKIGNTYDQY